MIVLSLAVSFDRIGAQHGNLVAILDQAGGISGPRRRQGFLIVPQKGVARPSGSGLSKATILTPLATSRATALEIVGGHGLMTRAANAPSPDGQQGQLLSGSIGFAGGFTDSSTFSALPSSSAPFARAKRDPDPLREPRSAAPPRLGAATMQ